MPSVLDNRRRTSLAVLWLTANCVVEAASVVFYMLLLLSLDGVSLLDSRDLEGLEGLLSICWLGSLLFTAIWFIAWLYRAYGNALAMGARSHWSQGWAIGGWFVPLMNLIVPFQIVAAVRRNAEAMAGRRTGGQLEVCWWSAWLAGNVVEMVAVRMMEHGQSVGELMLMVSLTLVGALLQLFAGICAIAMVRRLTSMQQQAAGIHVARTFDANAPGAIGLPGAPSALWRFGAELVSAMFVPGMGASPQPVDDPAPPPVGKRRQVIGSPCDGCSRPIRSALDVAACRSCGSAFHGRCAPNATCVKCGGDDMVRGVAAI